MEFNLNGKIFKGDDIDTIYCELSSINVQTASRNLNEELINLFNQTDNNKLRDKVALIFADLGDKYIVPILIKKINEIKYSKHISTLIYACSEYDCAEWIDFFVGLIIDLNDSSYLEAIGVIEEMHSQIKLSDKIICVKRLSDCLASIDRQSEKYKDVESVLELIDNMAVDE